MNKSKREWQDVKYVLSYFGRNLGKARKGYLKFVEEGIEQGRRPELVGGGLIRSLGGWAEINRNRLNKRDRIKSDERILGDSEFVMQVLAEANEAFDRRYELKSKGYDISKIEKKVIDIFGIERGDLYSGRRKRPISEARSVFCYWCVKELGESMTSMAKRLGLTQPAVGYAVDRGEQAVKEMKIELLE
jgi:hypothetical protein